MSKNDSNTFSIPTSYKGLIMRSHFEARIARFLDLLEIKWQYEPRLFILSNGISYKPDFYLPELDTWIEVKGFIEEHNKEYSRIFAKDNKAEIILLSSNFGIHWFSNKDFSPDNTNEDQDIQLGKCSHCNSYFFCSGNGIYNCRKCNSHEGDHDIIARLEDCNFVNLDSIKEVVERYGIGI